MDGRSEAYHYHITLSVLVCVNPQRRYLSGRFNIHSEKSLNTNYTFFEMSSLSTILI